jgi:hypothetical protein
MSSFTVTCNTLVFLAVMFLPDILRYTYMIILPLISPGFRTN